MKVPFKTILALLFAPCLALSLVGCDVDVQDDGELPEVEVEEGRMPDVDVRTPDVDVEGEKESVTVPDVDVETEEKEITVPDVDVDVPEENENE